MTPVEKVLEERASQDTLFEDAMSVHKRYCDRNEKNHECVGEATIKRGVVCLSCKLCGDGEHSPLQQQVVKDAVAIFSSAGLEFGLFSAELRARIINALSAIQKRIEGQNDRQC